MEKKTTSTAEAKKPRMEISRTCLNCGKLGYVASEYREDNSRDSSVNTFSEFQAPLRRLNSYRMSPLKRRPSHLPVSAAVNRATSRHAAPARMQTLVVRGLNVGWISALPNQRQTSSWMQPVRSFHFVSIVIGIYLGPLTLMERISMHMTVCVLCLSVKFHWS